VKVFINKVKNKKNIIILKFIALTNNDYKINRTQCSYNFDIASKKDHKLSICSEDCDIQIK